MKRYLIQLEDYRLLWTDDEAIAREYAESDVVIDLQKNRSLNNNFDTDAIEEAEPLPVADTEDVEDDE